MKLLNQPTILVHKIALDLNNVQSNHMDRCAGTSRFAYNWALAEWKRQYDAHKENPDLPTPSRFDLDKQLNSIKHTEFPWMREVNSSCTQTAIAALDRAFKNFFAGRTKYPRFHSRFGRKSFTVGNTSVRVDENKIRLTRIGWLRITEDLRFDGEIKTVTFSKTADRWFVSLGVAVDNPEFQKVATSEAIGVDLGVTDLAVLSTGEIIEGPKALRSMTKKMVRLSRSLSRKQKGSANRKKAQETLARFHARLTNIRSHHTHGLTTALTRQYGIIGIEDLNVKGMVKNHHLSRAISDQGFGEFRRQVEYKAKRSGSVVYVADRWFPSSKTCSDCGHKIADMKLSVRQWTCPECGSEHHRDVNAAINLKNLAEYAVNLTVSACGGEGSGSSNIGVKPAPVKQETGKEVAHAVD